MISENKSFIYLSKVWGFGPQMNSTYRGKNLKIAYALKASEYVALIQQILKMN